MIYKIYTLKKAQKELINVARNDYRRIKTSILALSGNPRPGGCRKLTGRDGWRIRVGAYRIIYEIDEDKKTVTVLHIGHRRDIYRLK